MPLVVDAGSEAEVEMLLDDLTRGRTGDIAVTDAGVIRALWRRVTCGREAGGRPSLYMKYSCSKPNRTFIVKNGGALVRRVRRDAVRHHDFAHHQNAVGARAVRINRNRLEHAIRASAFSLHG
jgi:hypothetical protein